MDDIAEDDGGLVLILRTNKFRRLKTEQSERLLPLPEESVRLGFLDYCALLQDLGYEAVFPDLFSDKTLNDPGDRFYDVFLPIMNSASGRRCGIGLSMRCATAWQMDDRPHLQFLQYHREKVFKG
ncbi:hypothetical protein [Rhizobium leguminosarum]|uniref:hypothetical protein n=1 Tax=Rhizobium leguminosarum TaxID=384 RepID=UPI001FED61DF|nr:hypothetical protein [Rhizobium leguminosarum]